MQKGTTSASVKNLQIKLLPLSSIKQFTFFYFFYLGLTPCKAKQPIGRHGVTRKEAQKRLHVTDNLLRKNLQLKDIC